MDQKQLIELLAKRAGVVDPFAVDPNQYGGGGRAMDPYTMGRQINWGALPGADAFYSYDIINNQERVDPKALRQYMADNGYQWMGGSDPASQVYGNWIADAAGNPVADSARWGSTNEERFKIAAILAATTVGAAAYGAGVSSTATTATGAGTAATGAGEVVSAGAYGSLGEVAGMGGFDASVLTGAGGSGFAGAGATTLESALAGGTLGAGGYGAGIAGGTSLLGDASVLGSVAGTAAKVAPAVASGLGAMDYANLGLAVVSTGLNIKGQQEAKKAAEEDAKFEAVQQMEAARRSRAIGQRQAIEERRQARLVSSALQARAMGGGLDPTVVRLSQDIAGEGEYRALAALYEGDSGALGLESQASAGLRSANAYARARNISSVGTLLSGVSDMYTRYSGLPRED